MKASQLGLRFIPEQYLQLRIAPQEAAACQHGSGVRERQNPSWESGGVHQAHLPLLQTDPRAPLSISFQTRDFGICRHHSHR